MSDDRTQAICPRCQGTIRRSRTRGWSERIRKIFTSTRPFRCESRDWRGWRGIPDTILFGPAAAGGANFSDEPLPPGSLDSLHSSGNPSRQPGGREFD
jgi:hypothetical protein